MQCEYSSPDQKYHCPEEALEGSSYCILHIPLPQSELFDPEYEELSKQKETELKRRIGQNYFVFRGVILGDIDLSDMVFEDPLDFSDAEIRGKAKFTNCTFEKTARFKNTKFGIASCFDGSTFGGFAHFNSASVRGGISFEDTVFEFGARFDAFSVDYVDLEDLPLEFEVASNSSYADKALMVSFDNADLMYPSFENAFFGKATSFCGAKFKFSASFAHAKFCDLAQFYNTKFCFNANFEQTVFQETVAFNYSEFHGLTTFNQADFMDDVTFDNAKAFSQVKLIDAHFHKPAAQEAACRFCKILCEKNGSKHEADRYFFREMEAIRLQKVELTRYLEYFFLQGILGYGVHPLRTFAYWLLFIGAFFFIFWLGSGVTSPAGESVSGWQESLWFSITTGITPGFGGYKPASGTFQLIAGMEAIIGTFMWAAFIAILGRKYMR